MDNTQLQAARMAVDKARRAAMFKRRTKAFQTRWQQVEMELRVLGLKADTGGGIVLMDGKMSAPLA